MESRYASGSAVASISKELRSVLGALEGGRVLSDPLDELQARRVRKLDGSKSPSG
jgi:hypothetical protein